jgi:hypothetical protein
MRIRTLMLIVALLSGLAVLPGCQSQGQVVADAGDTATQTALRRGKFELGCPSATATVLSNEMLQPVLWGGRERVEYTIGVSGCSKKATYIVICPESDECFAASGQENQTDSK